MQPARQSSRIYRESGDEQEFNELKSQEFEPSSITTEPPLFQNLFFLDIVDAPKQRQNG